MNTIRLVYTYENADAYERHERLSMSDTEYAEAAGGMPFVDGTIVYSIYRLVEVAG
jgi:hypothetical protein